MAEDIFASLDDAVAGDVFMITIKSDTESGPEEERRGFRFPAMFSQKHSVGNEVSSYEFLHGPEPLTVEYRRGDDEVLRFQKYVPANDS